MNCKICQCPTVPLSFAPGWHRCQWCGSDSAEWGYDQTQYDAEFNEHIRNHRNGGHLDDDGLRGDMGENTSRLLRADVPERSIIDIGCGPGVSRAVFEGAGWTWAGFDVHHAEESIVVAPEFRAELFPRVGTLMAREIIEHVPDARVFLRECRWALLPRGILQIQTPRPIDGYDSHLHGRQHLFLLSPLALQGILWEAGFLIGDRLDWSIGQLVMCRASHHAEP